MRNVENKKRLYNKWFEGEAGSLLNKIDNDTGQYYYISYNKFNLATENEETALILQFDLSGNPTRYVIVNGDFRNEFEKCKTILECLKVFAQIKNS